MIADSQASFLIRFYVIPRLLIDWGLICPHTIRGCSTKSMILSCTILFSSWIVLALMRCVCLWKDFKPPRSELLWTSYHNWHMSRCHFSSKQCTKQADASPYLSVLPTQACKLIELVRAPCLITCVDWNMPGTTIFFSRCTEKCQ